MRSSEGGAEMASASEQWSAGDDEELIGALRRVLAAADPVPDSVLRSAHAALGMRTLDAELAELLADSASRAASEPELSLARSNRSVRLLSFATAGGEVEVEMQVEAVGARRNIVGQLLGAAPGSISLDTDAGSTEVGLDEAGLFSASGVGDGLLRLRCTSAKGAPVATSWVVL